MRFVGSVNWIVVSDFTESGQQGIRWQEFSVPEAAYQKGLRVDTQQDYKQI
jgi:hypothetical protein